jgi:hypothetical protein
MDSRQSSRHNNRVYGGSHSVALWKALPTLHLIEAILKLLVAGVLAYLIRPAATTQPGSATFATLSGTSISISSMR